MNVEAEGQCEKVAFREEDLEEGQRKPQVASRGGSEKSKYADPIGLSSPHQC